MFKTRTQGFTLIEMIIVIGIISILALVIYGALQGGTAKGRDTKRHAEIGELALAFRLYAEQHDAYPSYPSGIKLGEGEAIDDALEPFMQVPHDPSGPDNDTRYYFYDSSYNCPLAGGTKVVIYANEMEYNEGSNGNWNDVCEADGPSNRYGIVLN